MTHRLIQQARLRVLQRLIGPTIVSSYGFRPGRSAHQAVLPAQAHVQAGYGTVVDVDLEKFFDGVNRDPDGPAGPAGSGQGGPAAGPSVPAGGHPRARRARRAQRADQAMHKLRDDCGN